MARRKKSMAEKHKKATTMLSASDTSITSPPASLSAPAADSTEDIVATSDDVAAADSVQEKKGLVDLPVEIRTQIYGYLLVESERIYLKIRQIPRSMGEGREVCRQFAVEKTHRRREYNRSLKKWIELPTQHTSILYINKQIYLEAEPVLYGGNILQFQRTTVLKDFLEIIGKRAQYLHHVRIAEGGYVRSSVRGALKLLCAATGLRKLEFGHLNLCTGRSDYRAQSLVTVKQLAQDCKTLARSLQSSYEKGGLVGDALDVFSFYLPPCYDCAGRAPSKPPHQRAMRWGDRCRCSCGEAVKGNERLEKRLREEIAMLLPPAL